MGHLYSITMSEASRGIGHASATLEVEETSMTDRSEFRGPMRSMRTLLEEFDAQHPAAPPDDLAVVAFSLSECQFEASWNIA